MTALLSLPQLASAPASTRSRLGDRHGRGVGYLRLSLTRGCSMRCVYCRPGFDQNPRDEDRLTPAEIEQIVRHLAQHHGLHKVRLTGGDPTVRPELVEIIQRIAAVDGIRDLAMTTNGLTLARQAKRYADAGLRRVNVSLDSLDPQRFADLTGVDGLGRVLRGIAAAQQAFTTVKLNCVVIRGENDADLPALLRWAVGRGLPLRLIELMPMGPLAARWAERFVSEAAMREALAGEVRSYQPITQGSEAARRYRVTLRDGQQGDLGFITPMSCLFCAACDRLRLGADGAVYPCLMDEQRGSVRDALSPVFSPARFDTILRNAFDEKAAEHPAAGPATMTHLGG